MKIHHIGYAVNNIDKALLEFSKLGFQRVSKIFFDEKRKVKICFVQDRNVKIELIEPTENTSPAKRFLKNGAGPYHICYQLSEGENFEKIFKKGYVVVQPPDSAVALENRKVAFLYNNTIGLIEVILPEGKYMKRG